MGCCVVVCGGGDFVVDWVFMFEKVVSFVVIVYCCNVFCVYEYSVNNLEKFFIVIKILFILIEVFGNGDKLMYIIL